MKVVALISGGKDSCYAMMKCIQYGHQIVALANLMPVDDSVDDLDSYMYQTVGHQMVACYAECMGLPLFRRRIQGSHRHGKLNYSETIGDEVEDLFVLLNEVKMQMPSVTAVSSGAIASDYQRLRVESVCSRLGLVSLAYLWKQDQSLLLREMITNGITAIMLKVACIGLEPRKHLGKSIADLESHLQKLNELYGVNMCGEGGEYETLTLDCPLFCNARIVLEQYETIFHSTDSIAPVGVIHPLKFHLEFKEHSVLLSDNDNIKERFQFPVIEVEGNSLISLPKCKDTADAADCSKSTSNLALLKIKKNTFSVCSWLDNPSNSSGVVEDLIVVLTVLESRLRELGFYWKDVLYIHMYIADMNYFSEANDAYVRFITQLKCPTGVPSRSTVELPLLEAGVGRVYVEAIVTIDDSKNVLHVQSISSWAPSCIGPYSQATLHKGILHMAGQLGLDPSTMNLNGLTFTAELEQALQNCEAVACHFNSSISTSAILFTIYCSKRMPLSVLSHVQDKLASFVKRLELLYLGSRRCKIVKPLFLYILVSDLPKRALIEVKPLLYIPNDTEMTPSFRIPTVTTSSCSSSQSADWHKPSIKKCLINDQVCAIILSISGKHISNETQEEDDSHSLALTRTDVEKLSRLCVNLLDNAMLQESNFSWEHVTSLRIYYSSKADVKLDTLVASFQSAFDELVLPAMLEPMFSIVPVLAAGESPSMDDLLTCELLANKS